MKCFHLPKNVSDLRVRLWSQQKEHTIGIFKIEPHFSDQHIFIWQSVEILNFFNIFTLKPIFWKTKTFFKKLDCFLVESTNIENASFPYQNTMSGANIKTHGIMSTKWTYHKQRSFASNYLIFWNISFSLRSSYKELIWCIKDPNVHIYTFHKRWNFIWWWFFPVRILNVISLTLSSLHNYQILMVY